MALYSNINLFFIKLLTIIVPRFLFPPFALFWGGLFYLVLPRVRRDIKKNLRVVTGREEVGWLAFRTFYNFSRNWCDIMLMTRLRGERLLRLIGRWTSHAALDRALAEGRGAILASIHLGNWELGGLGLAEQGYPINILTFREPDEKVNQQREAIRRERGINFIYVDRNTSSPFAMVEAVSALNRNEVLAILGDRDGSSHTKPIEFFGRPTPIPIGPGYLALASGAPVIPVFVPMEGNRYAAIMEKPIYFKDQRGERERIVLEGTREMLQVFERYIRSYPDQWYNFFDYFGGSKSLEKKE